MSSSAAGVLSSSGGGRGHGGGGSSSSLAAEAPAVLLSARGSVQAPRFRSFCPPANSRPASQLCPTLRATSTSPRARWRSTPARLTGRRRWRRPGAKSWPDHLRARRSVLIPDPRRSRPKRQPPASAARFNTPPTRPRDSPPTWWVTDERASERPASAPSFTIAAASSIFLLLLLLIHRSPHSNLRDHLG